MRWRPWLQLFRAPNLFTVPGDPLAGYLLATGGKIDWSASLAILASLALYGAGLLLNDLCDLAEDRRERPARPLPSGAIRAHSAWVTVMILVIGGMALGSRGGSAGLFVVSALLLAVLGYNFWSKKLALVGALNMGACRGLSILLGAAFGMASRSQPVFEAPAIVFLAAGIEVIYIAGVTHLARFETSNPSIPPKIGQLIRRLIPLQAAFCLASPSTAGTISAACLLILWPLAGRASKSFHAS